MQNTFPIKADGKHEVNKTLAQAILDSVNNDLNRPLKPQLVRKYMVDMMQNNWHYNADPIRISDNGDLLDGQHRLTALVEADTVEQMYFILDLPTVTEGDLDMFTVIDQGSRKPYEVLAIAHPSLVNPKGITTLLPKLDMFNISEYLTSRQERPTNKSINTFANQFMPLDTLDALVTRSLTLYERIKSNKIITNYITKDEMALYTATIGLCENGNKFLETLATIKIIDHTLINGSGYELNKADPLHAYFINIKRLLDKNIKLNPKTKIINMFSAYNDFVLERETTSYKGTSIIYPTDYPNYN